jgi:uncharacterized protein YqjF (DUF2071 family)
MQWDSVQGRTTDQAIVRNPPGAFLRAGWHHLLMLNYPADASALAPYMPAGTELDLWNGQAYLSVVGFMFLNVRVRGIPIPFHRNFEEVNLRTYVRRWDGAAWRRGVVFIKEIVPRWMIACLARRVYNENYVSMPMRHELMLPTASANGIVRYEWSFGDRWHSVSASIEGEPSALVPGSEAEFITEHYWGYCRQRDGSTLEYGVEHVPWRVWTASDARLDCDVSAIHGAEFVPFLSAPPTTAFVAEGSPIVVRQGVQV